MPGDPTLLLSPKIQLGGSPLSELWKEKLIEVRVDREFRVPSRCTLRFSDFGFALTSSSTIKLGSEITVEQPTVDSMIKAEVTSITVEHRAEGTAELVIVGHDRGHRLGRGTTIETYLKMKASDIVRKVAGTHGLQAVTDDSSVVIDYLLHVDSDMALINQLANRTGFDWWVEDKTLHFKKPAEQGTVDVDLENDLESLAVRASGHRPTVVKVDGWDRKAQKAIQGEARDNTALLATSDLASTVKSTGGFGDATLETAVAGALTADEATQLGEAMRDRMVAAAVTAKGIIHPANAKVKPGTALNIKNAGPLSGTYAVTKVEHIYGAAGFRTRFVTGDRTPTSLVDTLGGGVGAGAPAGGNGGNGNSFRHLGVVTGEVTNINDPDKLGRVKLKYPGLSATNESAWARVVTTGGGKKRGTVFTPEVGDEVLVAFENGDPRQPVVLGGLYGDRSGIPKSDIKDGKVASRQITSRNGHLIELSDGTTDETQHILMQLDGGQHKIRVGKDRVDIEVPNGKPVSIKAGSTSIAFTANGDVSVEGANITIKAKQNLTLEGVQVKVEAKAQLDLEGKAQAALKAPITNVEGSGQLALKGGVVMIN